MRAILYISLVYAIASCTSIKENNDSSKIIRAGNQYFKDFDLFQIRATREIQPDDISYPYVQLLKNEHDTINIIINYSKDSQFSQTFTSNGNCWKSEYEAYESDSGRLHKYKSYHTRDSVVRFDYATEDELNFYLVEVSITTHEVEESYVFSFFDKIVLEEDKLGLIPFDKKISSNTSIYLFEGDILKENSTIYNYRLDKVMQESSICYDLSNASFFWFLFNSYEYRMNNCP